MIPPPSLPHFACEGCGIKFKSVSNLQAHQARYCAGLRKASEDAFEAMVIKQKQAAQAAAAQAAAAKLPMLEMMNLLNAKNAEQEKLSSIMMSSMAAAALASAQSGNGSQTAVRNFQSFSINYQFSHVKYGIFFLYVPLGRTNNQNLIG